MPSYIEELSKLRFPRDYNTSPVSVLYLFNNVTSDFAPLSGEEMPDGRIALNTNLVGGLLQVDNLQVVSFPQTALNSKSVTTLDNYDLSTSLIADTHELLHTTFLIKNTGANYLYAQILGSLDGTEYDIVVVNQTRISPGASLVHYNTDYLYSIQLQVRSFSPGSSTTATLKFAGIAL